MDYVDLDVGREGYGSRIGLASATIEVGKAQGRFPFLHICVGGVQSAGKEPFNDRLPDFDKYGLKG
jgi:hypothetical protein